MNNTATANPTKANNASISWIRLLATLMIVSCHIMQYHDCELAWWFNVGVQVFLVMSGFLYGNRNTGGTFPFLQKRLSKILVPYFVFLLPVITLYAAYFPDYLSPVSVVKALFCVGTIKGLGHLWFVGYILFCYFLTPYLELIRNSLTNYSLPKAILAWCAIIGTFCIIGELTSLYFRPPIVSCFIAGYAIASLHGTYGHSFIKRMTMVVTGVAIVLNAFKIYAQYFTSIEILTKVSFVFDGYIHMSLGLALFFSLYVMLRRTRQSQLLRLSDQYSYPIYIVHLLFILSPFTLMTVSDNVAVSIGAVLLSTLLVAVMLQKLCDLLTGVLSKRIR